jgi:malonyl-CoA decarboxylase
MNTSFFGELLQTISERGRALLTRNLRGEVTARSESLVELCEELLSSRGEASGVARAREILTRYGELTAGPRIAFFEALERPLRPRFASLGDCYRRLAREAFPRNCCRGPCRF